MKSTIHSSNNRRQRSCVAHLVITLLLLRCTHAFLRGASSSSSEDDDAHDDSTCQAIERASTMMYRSLVVFGDSYSDTGNIWGASNHTQPPSPPYYQGRYSNGRNYVDFVREALQSQSLPLSNYAWGGATSNNDIVVGYSTFLNATVPSFQDQVRDYLNQTANETTDCTSDDDDAQGGGNEAGDTLYIAVIGYNDYWWYANENVTASTTSGDMEDFVARVATSIITSVQELVARPRCREQGRAVLVGNLPPMDLLPDALSKTDAVRQAYKVLTELHNAKLRELLSSLNGYDHTTVIRLLPVHETIVDLVSRAPCLGFDDASTACLGTGADGAAITCGDPFRHLFLDDWHPMTWTHQKLGGAVLNAASLR